MTVRQRIETVPDVSLALLDETDAGNTYGLQPPTLPSLSEDLIQLTLVDDLDDPNLGPAHHFQTTYDKVVILRADEFVSHRSGKRSFTRGVSKGKQIVAGDMPWFCHWDGTLIEGYLYVTSNSSQLATPTSSSSIALPSPSSLEEAVPNTPFATKIEERRLPVNTAPGYCQQMQMLDSGDILPAVDDDGNTIVVNLKEKDPTMENFHPGSARRKKSRKSKRADPENSCHCQWTW
ncbi:uncharacterized protein BDZ99DRAFT_567784 [Mytilinidion resinicola]|uniref:DUF7820 domain-containing protein n=1 Tax=Mytilinidion resinicola TaxID=574789 RepID=A0A6A6YZ48_9PEZI|nr:uncharacterized protein BDZ99DRAFT_567784 [Mytilinidion resinicola]KAF2814101.1 hypothetical protein BDZ99DRAFT_567784 [Mytilinidion resinicola]